MFQRLRRSIRRKKASYCVNCGRVDSGCCDRNEWPDYENHNFHSLPGRHSLSHYKEAYKAEQELLRQRRLGELFATYDQWVSS